MSAVHVFPSDDPVEMAVEAEAAGEGGAPQEK